MTVGGCVFAAVLLCGVLARPHLVHMHFRVARCCVSVGGVVAGAGGVRVVLAMQN